jgi:hypothetical protein
MAAPAASGGLLIGDPHSAPRTSLRCLERQLIGRFSDGQPCDGARDRQ